MNRGRQAERPNADSLRRELADAFAARERPSDDRLAIRRPDCPGYEGEEAYEWLRGKSWQDLLAEGMGIEHRDLVHFLRFEGWLYFFPALATFALDIEHPAEMDAVLLYRLGSFSEEELRLLTPAERQAIVHLLEYLAEAHEQRGDPFNYAKQSLDSFWGGLTDEELHGIRDTANDEES